MRRSRSNKDPGEQRAQGREQPEQNSKSLRQFGRSGVNAGEAKGTRGKE